ncbi:TPA: hypothetical protein ACH7TX_000857 [Escherichia coli]
MKYLVTTGAVLRFTDGSQVELIPGVHSFDKHVTEHWAFGAHARAIDEDELQQNQAGEDLSIQISALESTITELQQQVSEKDVTITEQSVTITELQQQVGELAEKLAAQETGNAKKQSSANK